MELSSPLQTKQQTQKFVSQEHLPVAERQSIKNQSYVPFPT